MYKNKFILSIIPARGGSKGIPKKNIKLLAGKPLIAWSIEQAKASTLLDKTIVSTDSKEIAEIAKKQGGDVPFMRPAEFAQDTSPMYTALQHAVREYEKLAGKNVDIIVLIDPTSPLRIPEDIDKCIKKVIDDNLDTVMTVYESNYNPFFNMVTMDDQGLTTLAMKPKKPIYRRQDAPKVYNIASDIYAMTRKTLMEENTVIGKKTGAIIIPLGGVVEGLNYKIDELTVNKAEQLKSRLSTASQYRIDGTNYINSLKLSDRTLPFSTTSLFG